MSNINVSFLVSGLKWDSNKLSNLKFEFSDKVSSMWPALDLLIGPDKFSDNYSSVDNTTIFSHDANSNLFDQKDVVRFLFLDSIELAGFSGDDTINTALVNSVDYRVSFSDVITGVNFSEDVGGEIRLTNFVGKEWDSFSLGGKPSFLGNSGDVVINNHADSGWDNFASGQTGYWMILHELGHAVGGFNDFKGTSKEGTYVDNQKYTVMSYKPVTTFVDGVPESVYASGLQLLDIKAIQDTYDSQNTATRNEEVDGDPLTTGTKYALGQGLGFAGAGAFDPFLYTIWDGGGIDTIDASGFSALEHGAEIDLREGRFSSIGSKTTNGDRWNTDDNPQTLDPDPGNVAIAYGTVIDNAIGTNNDDHLIGNEWANRLEGLDGADTFTGRGAGDDIFIGGAGGDTIEFDKSFVTLESQTGITLNLTSSASGTITDEYGDTDTFSEIENFKLTVGMDTVYAESDGINNIIKGNLGHDKYINSNGILEIKDGELWVWDEFGHTHDVLQLL